MPLGDSITAGNGPEGAGCAATPRGAIPDSEKIGYRARLLSDLDDANYMVNFVGGLSFGSSATPPITDPDHEGHGGFTASQLAQNVAAWLNTHPTDIVLLHVGTNNINSDDPNLTIINIEQILDAIDTWEASNNEVTVLLSTLIERSTRPLCDPNPVYNNVNVSNLNGLINNLVSSRTNDRLILVDQHGNIVPATHLSEDGVHPNPTGYEQMAVEWFDTLTDTSSNIDILRCPTNN
jgi:lysophospholipase L1-like esterase